MENGRNRAISAILFDLDNTLIATRKADKQACSKLAHILWEKWKVPTEIASNICKSYLRAFRKCPENLSMGLDTWRRVLWAQALGEQYSNLAGEETLIDVEPSDKVITIKEKLEEREGVPPEQQRLIHQGKQLKDDRTIESYKLKGGEVYEIWLQLRYDLLALTPEVQTLLHKLRQHYFVGLITNGTSRAQWEKIERLHLQHFFDVVLVSGDLPWEKPHQKIFQLACDYLGVRPQHCIMVGDKLETDILGGAEANLGGTVWIPLNDIQVGDFRPLPDHVIKHVTDLPRLLPKNPKIPKFRRNLRVSLPDLEDGNSNSSDGS